MKRFLGIFLALAAALCLCTAAVSAEGSETSLQTTAAQKEAAAENKTYAADKASVIGKWYSVYDFDGEDSIVFYLYKSGRFRLASDGESMSGTYTVKNGLLTLTAEYEDEKETVYIPAVIDDGMLLLSQYDIEYSDFVRYKSGQQLDEYFDDIPLIFSKEKPVPANQEDILGEWVYKEWDYSGIEELGIAIFNKKSMTSIFETYAYTEPIIIKNGKPELTGKLPEGTTIDDDENLVYSCGGKLYYYDGSSLAVVERCEKKKLTKKMLEGAYGDYGFYFENGKLCQAYFTPEDEVYDYYDYTISGSYITLVIGNEKIKSKYYVTDSYVYLVNDEDVLTFTLNN